MTASGVYDWLKLTKNRVRFIFIYYALLLLIGLITSVISVNDITREKLFYNSILTSALVGSIGISLVGSSTYYIRKLYKYCIQKKIQAPVENNMVESLQQLGATMYFVIRPIFAIGFSILVVIALKSGLVIVSKQSDNMTEGFIYMTLFISFFCGFSSGHLIKALENYGKTTFEKLFLTNKEEAKNE